MDSTQTPTHAAETLPPSIAQAGTTTVGGVSHLDLFSGIGGFSLAAESCGFETVAFCEIDPEASLVLKHHWPHVPNLIDIRTVTRGRYPYLVPDLITGGVPCQPASALGLMRGTADERWLWPEAIRVMREFRPRYGVFENPPALLGLERGGAWNGIVSELVALGYDLWWDVFPAAAFGAGHLRERVILVCSDTDCGADWKRGDWRNGFQRPDEMQQTRRGSAPVAALAYPTRVPQRVTADQGNTKSGSGEAWGQPSGAGDFKALAPDAICARLQGHPGNGAQRDESRRDESRKRRPIAAPDLRGRVTGPDWWHEAHTGIPVLATGLPSRLVEAVSRCIGNSIVPQAVVPIFEALAIALEPR